MVACMRACVCARACAQVDLRMPVLSYENIEGGHGGAADAKQSAYVVALYQDFLFCALGGKRAGCR